MKIEIWTNMDVNFRKFCALNWLNLLYRQSDGYMIWSSDHWNVRSTVGFTPQFLWPISWPEFSNLLLIFLSVLKQVSNLSRFFTINWWHIKFKPIYILNRKFIIIKKIFVLFQKSFVIIFCEKQNIFFS